MESYQSQPGARPRSRTIPSQLVVDFDLYNVPGASEDIHLAFHAFQQKGPDIFWTPRNEGHWVITRAADIKVIQSDYVRFSHEPALTIPPIYSDERNYPIQVDPPRHRVYRTPLIRALRPDVVEGMISKIRELTIELMDTFLERDECEFVSEFAEILPIVLFLDLVKIPRSDRSHLLSLAKTSIRGTSKEIRVHALGALTEYLEPWVQERRLSPGEDLLSEIVNIEIDGSKIPMEDALPFVRTVLIGGLDTVASMLCFFVRFFAMNPGHRRIFKERINEPQFVRRAVEELMRRHGIVNGTRVASYDFDYNGIPFRKGDMILAPNLFVGLDDRQVERPLEVDFDRAPQPVHATFDFGPHVCPGASLARSELRIFLEEWFRRVPDFSIKSGTRPRLATGMANSVLSLEITW